MRDLRDGSSGGKRKIKPTTIEEIVTAVQNMPDKHRLMVILADSCALRFGELGELRRMDVDTKNAVIHVRRSVVRSKSAGVDAKAPKSEAGIRDVPIPPDTLDAVVAHRKEHAASGPQGLMSPGAGGGHLSPSAFYGKLSKKRRGKPDTTAWGWYEARRIAGREDLRFHDLRHGALTEAVRHGGDSGGTHGARWPLHQPGGDALPAGRLRSTRRTGQKASRIERMERGYGLNLERDPHSSSTTTSDS